MLLGIAFIVVLGVAIAALAKLGSVTKENNSLRERTALVEPAGVALRTACQDLVSVATMWRKVFMNAHYKEARLEALVNYSRTMCMMREAADQLDVIRGTDGAADKFCETMELIEDHEVVKRLGKKITEDEDFNIRSFAGIRMTEDEVTV